MNNISLNIKTYHTYPDNKDCHCKGYLKWYDFGMLRSVYQISYHNVYQISCHNVYQIISYYNVYQIISYYNVYQISYHNVYQIISYYNVYQIISYYNVYQISYPMYTKYHITNSISNVYAIQF